MSYTITHANGTTAPIVIADGQIDTSTSITLVGKNTPNYGSYLNQNFFNMLENFAANSSPASPLKGQLWYDTSQNILKIWNGGFFKNVASASAGAVGPLNPTVGDFWFDTNNLILNCYTPSSGWLAIGPTNTGAAIQEVITDSGSSTHYCLSFQINGIRYAILSKDAAFTPLNPGLYPGFATISPGMNIVNTSFVSNNKFWGMSSDSYALNGIPGTNFMRSDQNTGTTGILSVLNNAGLKIGTAGQGQVYVSSNEIRFDNALNNGIIRFQTRSSGGSPVDSLDVLGNADVQVNYNLIVNGNLTLAGTSQTLRLIGTTPSTDTNTGTLQVPFGGVGIGGNLNVGGTVNNFSGNIRASNITTTANVFAVAVVSPQIGNSSSTLTGTISTAAQTNITSLGTLTALTVNGTSSLGPNTNVKISGGTSGQFLQTDGSGNLTWTTVDLTGVVNSGGTKGYVAIYNSSTSIAANAGVRYNNANLTVTGNFTATGDIVAYYSDNRLKTNITPINNALEKVNMINGVTYNTNDLAEKLGLGDTREHVGVIAQEIQSVLPQVISLAPFDRDDDGNSKSGENYLTVQYEKIIPLLIQAIKELSNEIDELKKRI